MATAQSKTPNGNPIAAISIAASALMLFSLRSCGLLAGAQSFATPMGEIAMTGDTAQLLASLGAFFGPQLIGSLLNVPILAELRGFLTVPNTLDQINSKIDTVVQATKKS